MKEEISTVPFYVHEAEMYRLDSINKRLWIALLALAAAWCLRIRRGK